MIKAIIFDLDGTILHTLADLMNAMNGMLRHFSYPQHIDPAVHLRGIGTGGRNFVKYCMPPEAAADEKQVEACLQKMKELYAAHINVETRPYAGINELFETLVSQDIKLNVLSNKLDEQTKILIAAWFGQYPIAHVFGEREGVPRKPDPRAALEIAENLGISPAEFAFVGDSDVDMLTAKNAGMLPIGVLWGYRPREVLIESGAAFLAEKPADIVDFIMCH